MKKYNRILILLIIVMMAFTWTACSDTDNNTNTSEGGQPSTETSYPLTITDDAGYQVTFEEKPETYISHIPSNTEILFALGLGDKIIGRDAFSNYPEEALDIEIVGDSTLNTELIIDLDPDVVFAFKGVPDDTKQLLESSDIKVVILDPIDIEGIFNSINLIAQVTDEQEKAEELIKNINEKREAIVQKIKDAPAKKVFIDLGEFYTAGSGTFLDDMLMEIQVENIAGEEQSPYPQLSLEKIVEEDPDVYISTFTPLEDIKKLEGIESISAYKNDQFILIPVGTEENDMIQRPGPRVMEGLEILARSVYPELFQ